MGNVGKHLKFLREKLGLSQLELSHRSGISQPSIARIESGQQRNLKTGTIEKLAAALEVPLLHLLEGSSIISEDASGYETARMIPVVTLQEFLISGYSLAIKDKHKRFEPSLSHDSLALFLTFCNSLSPDIDNSDLLLVEPSSQINSGDTVLLLSKKKQFLGRIYHYASTSVIQPLSSAGEPVLLPAGIRKNRDNKLFRVSELRKKL